MQRLRGIKQLGTTYLAYPGAMHTRFDHSIGVVHLTERMIAAINRNAEADPQGCLTVGEPETRIIRIAALLHDVTHLPFGHNIEDQTGLFHRHDSGYRFENMLSSATELGRVLGELGVREEVLGILVQDSASRLCVPAYWRQIMSDTVSSDILDYLQRDAYFTGLNLGVDARLANYFRVDRATGNLYIDLAKRDLLREDILSELVRMLEARYYFSERVYYHHAKVAAGALVARAVELALANELLVEEDFYGLTDSSLMELLARRAERGTPRVAQRMLSLLDRFQTRRLLKRVCVFPQVPNRHIQDDLVRRYFAPGTYDERQAAEERIARVVQDATGREVEVVLYCPAARMQLKEAETHVRWPGEPGLKPLSQFRERIPRLADLERSYRELWKFYVFADVQDPGLLKKIQQAALSEIGGVVNVYRIECDV
jgi:HD superfamily phosphohydrolase